MHYRNFSKLLRIFYDILHRYRGEKLVGITILEESKRH